MKHQHPSARRQFLLVINGCNFVAAAIYSNKTKTINKKNIMKTKLQTLLVALTLLACLPHAEAIISATDTQITYQGMIINQLSRGSNTDDFVFTLFDTNSGGSRIAGPITNTAVAVNSNGLFTTTMN